MGDRQLILASTSRARAELLGRLRLPFRTAAPRFEENSLAGRPIRPEAVRALVLENARGKALSLAAEYPDAFILGSDQLGECEGELLSKPGTEAAALEQLLFLRGKEHRLHTAVVLLETGTGRCDAEVVSNHLRVADLTDERLRDYVTLEQPLHCAGSYMSEGLGIALFDYLRGDDPTAIVGLPLVATCRLLRDFGFEPLRDPSGDGPASRGGAR
jgi:septum formation protein